MERQLERKKLKEYQNFLKTFNLGAFANDIGTVLDEEPEVSRFYAELVPAQITPEEFWARLFFRLNMVYRAGNSGINLEEDDEEEEFTWDAEPSAAGNTSTTTVTVSGETSISTHNSVGDGIGGLAGSVPSSSDLKVLELKDENDKLKGIVKTLTGRVTHLEQQLAAAKLEIENQAKVIVTLQQQVANSPSEAVQKSLSGDSKVENNTDNVSQCSGDSGVVLHNSDTMSFPDEDSRHGLLAPPSTSTTASALKTDQPSSSHTSKTTRAYLAAVDDAEEDQELDGWN